MALAIATFTAAAQESPFGTPGAFQGGPTPFGSTTAPVSGLEVVTLSTAWSATGVRPGETIHLAVVLDLREHWHINPPDIEEPLIPTSIEPRDVPSGVTIAKFFPPANATVDAGLGPMPVYEGRTVVYLTLEIPEGAEPGEHPVVLDVTWQACDDERCLAPVTVQSEAVLRVVEPGEPVEALNEEMFEGLAEAAPAFTGVRFDLFGLFFEIDPRNLLLLLGIAAFGGFLLNLTPCVLPLIPIKIMGLAQAAENRGRCFLLGLFMAGGVIAFWLALGLMIATVTGFTAANQLFQYPWFTVTVGLLIAAMGLGMLGAFTVRLPQWVYRINPRHDTLHGSFGFGIMAAVLSTPCTAPFMGTAAFWAAGQNTAMTLSTFAAIGLGMAMPYVILSAFPALVEKMPRTGPASELIKQVMGLLILAAAAFFLGSGISGLTVVPPDPPTKLYWWAVGILISAAGLWLLWRTLQIAKAPGVRSTFVLLGGVLIIIGGLIGVHFTDKGPIDWIYYTPERLAEAQKSRKVVVMEFTAEWCLNCHALEKGVLHNDRVAAALRHHRIAPIKVDLTGNNPVGNEALRVSGSLTIPWLVIYNPSGQEVFRSANYTVQQVLDAIELAKTPSPAPATAQSETARKTPLPETAPHGTAEVLDSDD